jgi:hypothetical protein
MNPTDLAAWYISQCGTAAEALASIQNPAFNDAADRAVCEVLRGMAYDEAVAANAEARRVATVQTASLYMTGAAA